MSNKIELPEIPFPGIPEWLKKAREKVRLDEGERESEDDFFGVTIVKSVADESEDTFEFQDYLDKDVNSSDRIRALYRLFDMARCNHQAAFKIAESYEMMEIPGGKKRTASEWYLFAVSEGSVKACLRLALNPEFTGFSGMFFATLALENLYMFKKFSVEDIDMACLAALRVLSKKGEQPGERALELIEILMDSKDFDKSKYAETIKQNLQIFRAGKGTVPSLVVAKAKIIENMDFKAGIFNRLMQPIPLSPLPNAEIVRDTLNREFPWFAEANEILYGQLSVLGYSKAKTFRLRPIMLASVPGVGKTSWARRLAELANVPFRTFMCAGSSDSMSLRGTSRGWSTARPGLILETIATELVANPLFLLDELDKSSPDARNGRIWDVVLQLVEQATAKSYLDECLQVPCDVSQVSWIATVNELGGLPRALLERFQVVLIKPPGPEHFGAILHGAVNRFANELQLDKRMLPAFDKQDLQALRECQSPREINLMTRLILEERLNQARRTGRRH